MLWLLLQSISGIFFFNDTATTEIYTLSLHDALPICQVGGGQVGRVVLQDVRVADRDRALLEDRKSTRLNSSHSQISYAVFCLKKKKHIYIFHGIDHAIADACICFWQVGIADGVGSDL